MRFSVGYQLFDDDYFVEEIIKRKEHISEVYFSWGSFPNGRNNQLFGGNVSPEEAQRIAERHMKLLSDEKISLNILFNATCYGKDSMSRDFFQRVGDTICFFAEDFSLSSLTTTSPLIAKFAKTNFPFLDVRASVNMGIGTEEGMEYVADYFDSFYLKREYNRDFSKIKAAKTWCQKNGKGLHILANSGCLNNCSAHTFHDNLVSHESEISKMDNGYSFSGICHEFLKKEGGIFKFLQNTSFIRPEDVGMYEGLVSSMKLATRVNFSPVRVMKAYIDNKKHFGSVCDLLEPNHSMVFYPRVLDNSLIETEFSDNKLKYINCEKCIINQEVKNAQ